MMVGDGSAPLALEGRPTEAGPGEGLPGSLTSPEQHPSLWDRTVCWNEKPDA